MANAATQPRRSSRWASRLRVARVLAGAIFAGSLGAMAAAVVLTIALGSGPLTPDAVLFPLAYVAFGAVGWLITVRQPSNRVGILALLTGLVGCVVGLADSIARASAPIPGQEWAAWIAASGFPASLTPPLLLLLVFPTGNLASRRWTVVAALIVVGGALVAAGNALTPRFADYPDLSNPMGIEAFAGSPLEWGGVGWFPLLAGAVAAGSGLVVRLRRARGIERQQLKWVTFAAALLALSWVVLAFDLPGVAGELATYGIFFTMLLVPIATGIAILRYRLYEIDVVIRRTVTYGAVVAVLGATYWAVILGLQAVFSLGTQGDALAVAVSTLVTAALFGPVRSRIRAIVDRRFYRSDYDARSVLNQFAADLRHEVDLEAAGRTLVTTAGHAVQPSSAAVWILLRAPQRD